MTVLEAKTQADWLKLCEENMNSTWIALKALGASAGPAEQKDIERVQSSVALAWKELESLSVRT